MDYLKRNLYLIKRNLYLIKIQLFLIQRILFKRRSVSFASRRSHTHTHTHAFIFWFRCAFAVSKIARVTVVNSEKMWDSQKGIGHLCGRAERYTYVLPRWINGHPGRIYLISFTQISIETNDVSLVELGRTLFGTRPCRRRGNSLGIVKSSPRADTFNRGFLLCNVASCVLHASVWRHCHRPLSLCLFWLYIYFETSRVYAYMRERNFRLR